MSDRITDKKPEESIAGTARGSSVAGAAKAAVEQSMQAGAKANEAASTAAREQTSAMSAFASKAATTARDGVTEAAEAARANVEANVGTGGRMAAEQITQHMKTSMERAMTTTEELMSFGQGNFEAMVKSGQIWATGLQDLTRHMAQSAQAQFDGSVSAFKAMAGVKSVHEAIELQSSMARHALEQAVQDGGKLTDASLKLAEQTMAPITARVTLATERFGRTAA